MERQKSDFIGVRFIELWSTRPTVFLHIHAECAAYFANTADSGHVHNASFLCDMGAVSLSDRYVFIELALDLSAGTEIIVQYMAG